MRLFLLLSFLALAGCAHHAPRRVVLPTTAKLGRSIAATQTSVAKASAIVARSGRTGIAAGSEDFRQLKLSLDVAVRDAATAWAEKTRLDGELLTSQKTVDEQTGKLAWYVEKYNAAVTTIWWYRKHFLFPLIAAAVLLTLAVGVWLSARFSSWGARTFGPYLLGAQKLAALAAAPEAAPLVAAL